MFKKSAMAFCLGALFWAGLGAETPRVGQLENGFSYAIYPEPDTGRVASSLLLRSGSLAEGEGPAGLAGLIKGFNHDMLRFWLSLSGRQVDLTSELTHCSTVFASGASLEEELYVEEFVTVTAALFNGMTLAAWSDEQISECWELLNAEPERWMQGDVERERRLLGLLKQPELSKHPCSYMLDRRVSLSPKEFRDFYERSYRVDQAGILVMGPVDAEEVEAIIKEIYGPIPKPEPLGKQAEFALEAPREVYVEGVMEEERANLVFTVAHLDSEVRGLLGVNEEGYLELNRESLSLALLTKILEARFRGDCGPANLCLDSWNGEGTAPLQPFALWSLTLSCSSSMGGETQDLPTTVGFLKKYWQHLLCPASPFEWVTGMEGLLLLDRTSDRESQSLFKPEELMDGLQAVFLREGEFPIGIDGVAPLFGLRHSEDCEAVRRVEFLSTFSLEEVNATWIDWMENADFFIQIECPAGMEPEIEAMWDSCGSE